MKNSKLKAKIAKLEAEKAELKKGIYELIDNPDSDKSTQIITCYMYTRNYLKDKAMAMLFGSFDVTNKLSEGQGLKSQIIKNNNDGFDEDGCMEKFTNY